MGDSEPPPRPAIVRRAVTLPHRPDHPAHHIGGPAATATAAEAPRTIGAVGKVDSYREQLRGLDESRWEDFLLTNSGLPGRRANIELAQAVAAEGDRDLFRRLLTWRAESAPVGAPEEFLPFCGLLGLGRLAAAGDDTPLATLRRFASDPRWRCREAVAMALQTIGRSDFNRLESEVTSWAAGSPYEQRAAVAALCEPDLLRNPVHAAAALRVLDAVTAALTRRDDRHSDGFRVLRQGLGYCWSVAVAARPQQGKALFEKWAAVDDPDVVWLVTQNLARKRLQRLDAQWVENTRRGMTARR